MRSTPVHRRRAAWLYAHFCVCKSVSLRKTLVGFAPIRDSDIRSDALSDVSPRLGGLVEFYQSPLRDAFRPTGDTVPDYPLLAQFWWQAVAAALAGRVSPRAAMDALAAKLDESLGCLAASGATERCAPALADLSSPEEWLTDEAAPFSRIDEEGAGETISYDQLIVDWL
jgi:glycerol transport system substrate-binding protein